MNEDIYTNALADEFLPGVTFPFNWSVLADIVDASWNRVRRDLRAGGADTVFVRTFYHHAYWNMTRISALLRDAGLPVAVVERLFERPNPREHSILDEAAADRVLAIDRSAIIENLEKSILESERRLDGVQRKKGDWETEDEIIRELDLIIEILGEVIFRETSSWLLVGLNLAVLDEWTAHQNEVKSRRPHPDIVSAQPHQAKLEEVRGMAERYRSHWERSRTVRSFARNLAEERLFELGELFVKWNLLRAKEDVRYLTVHEVRQIVNGGCATNTCNNYALRAAVRRTEIDEHAVSGLPPVITGENAPLLPLKKQERCIVL